MDDLYQEQILDHYKNPRNRGSITTVPTGSKVTKKRALNASCGDSLEADFLVVDGVVTDFKWRGEGCAISQAATSILSEWVIGKTLAEVRGLDQGMMLELLGLNEISPARIKCLLLASQLFSN